MACARDLGCSAELELSSNEKFGKICYLLRDILRSACRGFPVRTGECPSSKNPDLPSSSHRLAVPLFRLEQTSANPQLYFIEAAIVNKSADGELLCSSQTCGKPARWCKCQEPAFSIELGCETDMSQMGCWEVKSHHNQLNTNYFGIGKIGIRLEQTCAVIVNTNTQVAFSVTDSQGNQLASAMSPPVWGRVEQP